MKLGNKGFVVSTLMYTLLIVFLFLIIGIITLLSNRKMILDKLKKDVKNELNGMTKYDYYPNGTVIYYNPVTNKICSDYEEDNSLNENKTGCMKWYTFNDSVNSNKVNMILDHNTTYKIAYNSEGTNSEPKEAKEELDKLVDEFKWKVAPRLISADEVAKITDNNEFNSASSTSSIYFNNQKYSWLYNYTQNCESSNCTVVDNNTEGYWTSNKVYNTEDKEWIVWRGGKIDNHPVQRNYDGVRPVITIDKKTPRLETAIVDNANVLKECNGTTTICINTVEDLKRLRDEVNDGDDKSGKTYILTADLYLGGKFDSSGNMLSGSTNWKPIGDYNSSPQKPFSGTFDGNGHVIRNMYINSSAKNTGLFGYTSGATIRNLGIEDSYIISNDENTGSLVGIVTLKTTIDSCYNKAPVVGGKVTGGIVGLLNSGDMNNSYNVGVVSSSSQQFAGGIIGYNNGNIKNSYNAGNVVNSGNDSGGIVGGAQGTINKTYNLGTITANRAGGITGQLWGAGKIQNSYNSGYLKDSGNSGGIVNIIYQNLSQQLSNNYYLNTSADYGIYASSNNNYAAQSDNNATPLSASQIPSVLSVINDDNAFTEDTKNINNGYPILKWESK